MPNNVLNIVHKAFLIYTNPEWLALEAKAIANKRFSQFSAQNATFCPLSELIETELFANVYINQVRRYAPRFGLIYCLLINELGIDFVLKNNL